jgi:hypothetical protein
LTMQSPGMLDRALDPIFGHLYPTVMDCWSIFRVTKELPAV